MNEKEKKALNYRFSGYQMPKIKLDATGNSYIVSCPHPYYHNQPLYWAKSSWPSEFANIVPKNYGKSDFDSSSVNRLYPFV